MMMCIHLALSSGTHKEDLPKIVRTLVCTWKGDFATKAGTLLEPKEGGDN